ncbi:cytochrome P450 [Actinoplanes flavus]|uniref:Cytochrome P450 n=1 Tax=Actinoplanes flavus TaxID=2820290 RepID=A0ABS3URG7_9ACTN|nr:cytochrome P450 [Actinoplanes flavus]MBO3741369.1 cytochrome P450 [Actinoplanes flavus]
MTDTEQGVGLAGQSGDAASVLAWFRRMRATEPVSHDEQAGVWHVFGSADVERILSDSATFSSEFSSLMPAQEDVDRFIKGNVLRKDPPQHRKLRNLASKAFTPRVVADLADRIDVIADELLDAMAGAPRVDLVADLAYPLPVIVIAQLLGIPPEDRPMFGRWADSLVAPESQTGFIPNAERTRAMAVVMREMNAYCLDHIRRRRAHPTDDLTSKLVAAELDGQRLDDEEIIGFVGLLLLAGHITTTALLSNVILCLDEHPEAAAALRADPAALPGAIEEVLRYRTPLAPSMRRTTRDVRIGEHTVPAGQIVLAWLASANRDERRFAEPDRFDIRRTPNPHLSFGHGIHFCLGAPLARLEVRIAMEKILARWSEISVGDGAEHHDARGIFGARRLPLDVRWA